MEVEVEVEVEVEEVVVLVAAVVEVPWKTELIRNLTSTLATHAMKEQFSGGFLTFGFVCVRNFCAHMHCVVVF